MRRSPINNGYGLPKFIGPIALNSLPEGFDFWSSGWEFWENSFSSRYAITSSINTSNCVVNCVRAEGSRKLFILLPFQGTWHFSPSIPGNSVKFAQNQSCRSARRAKELVCFWLVSETAHFPFSEEKLSRAIWDLTDTCFFQTRWILF